MPLSLKETDKHTETYRQVASTYQLNIVSRLSTSLHKLNIVFICQLHTRQGMYNSKVSYMYMLCTCIRKKHKTYVVIYFEEVSIL